MDVTGEATIALPPERTFHLFADLERSGEYSAPVIERRKITEGPIGAGTRFHAVDRWPGRTVEFEVEVTEFEPPQSLGAQWSDPMPGGWHARFQGTDNSTRLEFRATMNPPGIMGLLEPLLAIWARRQMKRFLADFTTWAEKQADTAEA